MVSGHSALVKKAARALREHGAPTEGLPADEFDCCATAVLDAVADDLRRQGRDNERERTVKVIREAAYAIESGEQP